MRTVEDRRVRFRELHAQGCFTIPNPYDVGTAKLLKALGFEALATTSSGFAATLGRLDGDASRDELIDHVAAISADCDLPLNVDAERCFAETPAGVATMIHDLAGAGAAGVSIEDWNAATGEIDPFTVSVERVAAAVEAANQHGVLITARCEHFLRGINDLDATIARLVAYRDAGAHVLYAPGPTDLTALQVMIDAVATPVNVLLRPNGPTIGELAAIGTRRVSVGGLLSRIALAAVTASAQSLLDTGQLPPDVAIFRGALETRAFG